MNSRRKRARFLFAQLVTPALFVALVVNSSAAEGVASATETDFSSMVQDHADATARYFESGTRSMSMEGIDQTATAIKQSFDEQNLTVMAADARVAQINNDAAGTPTEVSADITYYWKLRDAQGSVNEASATDTYKFTVHSPDDVTVAIIPFTTTTESATESASEPLELPPGEPASTDMDQAKPSSAAQESRRRRAEGEVAAQGMERLNYRSMVQYALLWTDGDHQERMNPDYPELGNNCANFVSQALHAGGWQYRQGWAPATLTNWSPDLRGPAGPSYTWGGAKYLAYFGHETGELTWMDNIWDALYADIYFMDWDPNRRPDGKIDHAALVTGRSADGPLITQKSPNRHNVPLRTYIAIAEQQGRTDIVWYGLRT